MKGLRLYLSIACFALLLCAGVWLMAPAGVNNANAALAEYHIDKLSCGSCVSNIEKALTELDGIASVEVNLTSNRGRVIYDPARVDSQVIGKQITGAGYPATLRLELGQQEYAALQQEQTQLGQQYVAKIGDRLLARTDFEALLRQRSASGGDPLQNSQLMQGLWQDVLQRELLLSAAEKNQVIVQEGEVDAKIDALRQGHEAFEQLAVKRYGSMDKFRARLHEDMIINRNIEDHVYAGLADERERQDKLQAWYAELQNSTEVIIFDPQLKAVSQGGSGCACCNS